MSQLKPLNKWDKYWMLTILWESKFDGKWKGRGRIVEKCKCDCWNITWVRRDYIKNWRTKSCWCLRIDKLIERSTTHWDSRESWWHPLYTIYSWIKERCECPTNSRYMYYWWRWIKCLWNSYEDFKNDMYESYVEHCNIYWRDNTSIDRIDNDWDYCKDNCKRSTKKEQCNNRRSNVKANIDWETMSLKEIYDKYSPVVWYATFYYRYRHWRDIDKALRTESQMVKDLD